MPFLFLSLVWFGFFFFLIYLVLRFPANATFFYGSVISTTVSSATGPKPWHKWSAHPLAIKDIHVGCGGALARVISCSIDQTCKVSVDDFVPFSKNSRCTCKCLCLGLIRTKFYDTKL